MNISLNQYTILLLVASLPLSSAQDEFLSDIDGNVLDVLVPAPLELQGKFKKVMTCEQYAMSFADTDFMHKEKYGTYAGLGDPNIQQGMKWGLHALQWKAFNHANTGGTYDANLANSLNPPAWNSGGGKNHVSSNGADMLDALENADSGIFKDSTGSPTDPNGSWGWAEEEDALAGAIMAAMNMHYWKTPTYVDTREYRGLGGVAVIEKVTLCVEGTKPPHEACNWEPRGSYEATCETDSLVLQEIRLARFGGDGVYTDFDYGKYAMKGEEWQAEYGKDDGATTPVLVFDPPAGTSRAEIEALKQQAEKIVSDSLIAPAKVIEMLTEGSIRGGSGGWN